MKPHRIVAAMAGALLAQYAAAQGNALNPAPINPATGGRWMDDDGLGTRIPAARTPGGQFYNIPLDPGGEAPAKADPGWITSGFIEAGGIYTGGNDRAQGFVNYKDLKTGAYINYFGLISEKPTEARWFEATGGAVGMDDQFYRVRTGRYNDWRVTLTYDSTPQVFTTTYRSLWNGVGTGNLTLVPGLKPGGEASAGATQTSIQNVLAATPYSELEVVRKKAALRVDKTLTDSLKLYASFSDEKRQGARPFGAVFGGGGGGGNLEIPETVDYTTYDFAAGAQYSDAVSSLNVHATASFFRNEVDTLRFQNPLYITTNGSTGLAATSFTSGRFDLVPDNEAYNLKAEYARALPSFFRGNFTASAAIGTMRQNDSLIAPTEFPLTGGTVTAGGVSLANAWNTTDALSRKSADARIDTRLADVGLTIKPASNLDVRGKLRYYETRNSSQYISCNPLTGQWGRILNDGSGLSIVTASTVNGANPAGTSANAYNNGRCDIAAVLAMGLAPVAGNIPVAAAPADYRQLNGIVSADYRLARASSIEASLERETFDRDFRERDKTWEDKFKLAYVDRGLFEGTVRLSYEYDRRAGSAYNTNPYIPFLSASFGPEPDVNTVGMQSWIHTIGQFRSVDLADRNQGILKGRVDYAVNENMDGALTLQLKDADFPADYGLSGRQRTNTATLDLNYQLGSKAVVYGYYTWQQATLKQRGIQPNGCVVGNSYYFYSNGQVLTAASNAAPPATPPGTTLLSTRSVLASNWADLCGFASPTSPLFPESRAWDVASKDRNDVLGLGAKYDFGKVKVDANFTRALGRTRIGYTFNAAALGMNATQANLAGTGLTDITFAQNIFNASAFFPLDANVLMRFLVRFESGKIRDWHYDALNVNPMPTNNAAYLDAGPTDYRSTMVGIMFHVRM